MTLKEQIERLKQLDAGRTPGEWIAGCHPGNERLNIIKPICFGKYVGKLPECEGGAVFFLHKGNAEFIAAAPDMMRVILKQQEIIEAAKAEIMNLARNEVSTDMALAALARLAEIEQGGV